MCVCGEEYEEGRVKRERERYTREEKGWVLGYGRKEKERDVTRGWASVCVCERARESEGAHGEEKPHA